MANLEFWRFGKRTSSKSMMKDASLSHGWSSRSGIGERFTFTIMNNAYEENEVSEHYSINMTRQEIENMIKTYSSMLIEHKGA